MIHNGKDWAFLYQIPAMGIAADHPTLKTLFFVPLRSHVSCW